VDHPDGLAAPASYFARLRERAPHCWLVAEKPLRPSAPLPAGWQVDGTTGYDFLALTLGLFIDPEGLRRLEGMWAERAGRPLQRFSELAAEGKRWVLRELLSAELARVARLAASALGLGAEEHRDCVAALEELVVALPVGRTFIESGHAATAEDRRSLWVAASAASATRPELGELVWRLVTSLEHAVESRRAFCARFQQLCAAAAAKGVEDTAFYRYGALIALAELGCDPDDAAFSVEDFHQHALEVQQSRPRTMNTTSTHDTKRGEDARLRLAVLSEMPREFSDALARFQALLPDASRVGEPLHQHLLQTLVACWPISEERLTAYALKAAREAKDFTSWRSRNVSYEEQLALHVRRILQSRAFVVELERFLEPVLALARRYSLSQLLLKLTAPGVPDVYQGSELWEEHLVDPDNRRPVDFAARHRSLAELRALDFRRAQKYEGGRWTKLWLLERVLRLRRELPHGFVGADASYTPLEVHGPYREQVLAFARSERVLVVVPRLLRRAPEGLRSTYVTPPSAGPWRSLLSERSWSEQPLDCAQLLGDYPVELLVKEP
jgi:(1->4)-alpha-D-glucan 1-alpha-D-glucosylmutase